MCGIAGFLSLDNQTPVDRRALKKMTDALIHRGPDAEGFHYDNIVALGHRRLSIIDLKSGGQPMYNEDRSVVVVYNGEIYNFYEIRSDLKKLGYHFLTTSDTEVLIRAYEQWGTACVERFNGMWAFALWDTKRQRLFCSRDRLGEKPFFYSVTNNMFIFASEMKALFAYGIQRRINKAVLDAYLCFTYIPAPHSIFRDISKLLPGHSLIVENGRVLIRQYWDIVISEPQRKDAEHIYEEFENLFREAVKIRLRSDVPVGAFLSGGLDSSSVVAIASNLSENRINTYTIGFEEAEFDERALARLVARSFGTKHTEMLVRPEDARDILRKLAWCYDEPFGDSSALPTYLVSKAAAGLTKVVLTGDGGDEVLSGYTIHQGELFAKHFSLLPRSIRLGLIPSIMSLCGHLVGGPWRKSLARAIRIIDSAKMDLADRIEVKQIGFTTYERAALIGHLKDVQPAREFIEATIRPANGISNFNQLNYWLLKTSLPDDMLCKVDRAAMANSIETRIPFLDYRLVELLAGVDISVKLPNYIRKQILRKTIGRHLPQELLRAKKSGFNLPLQPWLAADSRFNLLHEAMAVQALGLLNVTGLKSVIQSRDRGNRSYGDALWALASLAYCRITD